MHMRIFPTVCPACGQPSLKHDDQTVYCTSCHIYSKRLNFIQGAVMWAKTKAWLWRALIIVWVGYVFTQYLGDASFSANRIANPINAFNLGIHELGHMVFIPFGEFMTILGGSAFQVLFPLAWFAVAIWKRWYFAATMILCWVGFNLFDVATYAADARDRLLPLATLSSDYDQAHDWYQILSRLHHLELDATIAHILRGVGGTLIVLGLATGTVLVTYMLVSYIGRLNTSDKN